MGRLKPLTLRQKQVLETIRAYIRTHQIAPSFEELADLMDFKSLGSVYKHLVGLEKKGHITRYFNKARSIEIVEAGKGECVESQNQNDVVWYGPHACSVCGETIVRAAQESGGQELDVPAHLLRVYQRGSEALNVDVAYPAVWRAHVHSLANAIVQPMVDADGSQ